MRSIECVWWGSTRINVTQFDDDDDGIDSNNNASNENVHRDLLNLLARFFNVKFKMKLKRERQRSL